MSASPTSSRTRFCTEAELPSPKCFSRSLASRPLSGPNTSSTFLPKCSATVRARSVNWASSSREARSNSVFTYSELAAACSRSSTRAPISIASRTVLTGSSPACCALAHQADGAFVREIQVVDHEAVADEGDAGLSEWGGGFHR